MGVFYRPGKRGTKSYRCAIERHGVRFEKWFSTEAEAQASLQAWKSKLEAKFGKPYNRERTTERDHKMALLAKRRKELDEKRTAPAPCGIIKETREPRRCLDYLHCGHYESCLDTAFKRSWPGWEAV